MDADRKIPTMQNTSAASNGFFPRLMGISFLKCFRSTSTDNKPGVPSDDIIVMDLQQNTDKQNSDKISIIKSVYDQFHSYLRSNEDYEHKISLAAMGFFIIFAGYILPPKLGHLTQFELFLISAILIGIGLLVNWFLLSNVKEIRRICRCIVRFEKSLGVYENGLYLKGDTLLPLAYMNWGRKGSDSYNSSRPYFVGLWLSVVIAIGSLLYNYPADTASTSQTDISTLKLPDNLDITLHQPDLAAAAQKLAQDQELANRLSNLEKTVQKLTEDKSPPPPSAPLGSFTIHFTNRTDVSPDDFQHMLDAINSAKTASVVLCNGYSDKTGDDKPGGQAKNISLSNERANAIADILVKAGVPRGKITVNGYGTQKPDRMVEVITK